MLRNLDLSTWQGLLTTLLTLALITLIGVGVRVLMMMIIQQRRERANRQINERLKVLIAAYKVLGGSFTGTLTVDPTHLRDLKARAVETGEAVEDGNDRARRMRDAVEGALSDILLLGTEEQVRLAEAAARDLVAGQRVATAALVVSLRNFIRSALDLDPIPADLAIPVQGPTRPSSSANRGGRGEGGSGRGRGGGMGGGAGGGTGMGIGMGLGAGDDAVTGGTQPP